MNKKKKIVVYTINFNWIWRAQDTTPYLITYSLKRLMYTDTVPCVCVEIRQRQTDTERERMWKKKPNESRQ